ncbi:hypothetical protein APP_11850 [Aeribacillus pallidus]|nr:hypothetical protein APP_11850 [Aeribacillus pallidus]
MGQNSFPELNLMFSIIVTEGGCDVFFEKLSIYCVAIMNEIIPKLSLSKENPFASCAIFRT